MVEWVKKRLARDQSRTAEGTKPTETSKITEELLDELVSRDSGNQYGMDNMSAILIRFAKK
jgi:hypothetical protein